MKKVVTNRLLEFFLLFTLAKAIVFVCLKTPVIKYDFSREAAQINFPFEAVCLLNSIKSLFVTD